MLDPSHILTPLHIETLDPLMQDLFDLGRVQSHRFVHGGYMGQNFQVDTFKGVFFLKQYRNRMNTIIHEIKAAEAYFAQEGLPVIEPIKDRYGREAFWMEGNWYSLFPFIYESTPEYGAMTLTRAKAFAELLGKFHRAGIRFPQRPFQMLSIGNARKFHLEATELLRILERKPTLNIMDEQIREILTLKERLISQTTICVQDIPLPYDCLLHGDFQYLNVFLNEHDQISHVYDLERASLGPHAYEVARSLVINCFDDGWDERNFLLGKNYLSTYRETFPLTREDFLRALQIYTFNIICMTWIEARYLIFGVEAQLIFLERHKRRIEMLTAQDPREFCARVWGA